MTDEQPRDFAMPDVSDYRKRPSLLDHRGWGTIRTKLEDIVARSQYIQNLPANGEPQPTTLMAGHDAAREIEILARECIAAGDVTWPR